MGSQIQLCSNNLANNEDVTLGVLTLPPTALFREGDDWAVFVEESGQAKLRLVSIGQINGLVSEVLKVG